MILGVSTDGFTANSGFCLPEGPFGPPEGESLGPDPTFLKLALPPRVLV